MEILPTTTGTRPALACEIRPEGIVAARRGVSGRGAIDCSMAALSRQVLPEGAFRPSLHPGNILDRPAVITAIRHSLEKVVEKSRDTTIVVPDASVRVLLLDFDTLPTKLAEALPVVRFRLKKLLPFEADDAAISYQIMSTSRSIVRVVAIAMPRDVLAEYESAVREAGFEPGAILPSTLAVLAGLDESDAPALLINAGPEAVTAAIVRSGVLLLHRSVDMRADLRIEHAAEPYLPPAIPAELLASPAPHLPLVNREDSAAEWAEQEGAEDFLRGGMYASGQTALLERTPPTTPLIPAELPPAEIVQAVSVAAAYFEDTLGIPPTSLLTAGTTSAAQLTSMLAGTPLDAWSIHETIDPATLPSGQGPTGMPGAIPRGWLAGVQGALRG